MSELSHNKLNFQTVQSNTIWNPLKACNVFNRKNYTRIIQYKIIQLPE